MSKVTIEWEMQEAGWYTRFVPPNIYEGICREGAHCWVLYTVSTDGKPGKILNRTLKEAQETADYWMNWRNRHR